MNTDSKLWRSITGERPSSSGRTELSRRREGAIREQRRMFGDVDPRGRRY